MSVKTEDLRRTFEKRMQNSIEDQISRVVGYGKVTAIVNAEMNFDQISMNEEIYDPEGQVQRSSQTTQEETTEREPASDEVSVGTNLPGVGGDLLADNAPTAETSRTEEVTNFEISKTIRNTVRQSGEIQKLSVSILVDGRYTTDEDGNKTYEPRSEQEMSQITALVRSAIGYDEDRGDVIEIVNLQFAQIDTDADIIDDRMLFGFEKSDLIDAAEMLVVGIMLILVVLLVLQPMVTKLVNAESLNRPVTGLDELLQHDLLAASPANPALAPPAQQQIGADGQALSAADMGGDYDVEEDEDSLINIQGIEGKVKASTVKKVEGIVESYPTETVSVIRSWMSQES